MIPVSKMNIHISLAFSISATLPVPQFSPGRTMPPLSIMMGMFLAPRCFLKEVFMASSAAMFSSMFMLCPNFDFSCDVHCPPVDIPWQCVHPVPLMSLHPSKLRGLGLLSLWAFLVLNFLPTRSAVDWSFCPFFVLFFLPEKQA